MSRQTVLNLKDQGRPITDMRKVIVGLAFPLTSGQRISDEIAEPDIFMAGETASRVAVTPLMPVALTCTLAAFEPVRLNVSVTKSVALIEYEPNAMADTIRHVLSLIGHMVNQEV